MTYRHRWLNGEEIGLSPGKVVCVGRNYAAHVAELGNATPEEPVLFMKPATSLVPLEAPWGLPRHGSECHHETELALLLGAPLSQAGPEQARQAVAGYGLALDLTLRDVQNRLKEKGLPWELAKAFDASCPLSRFCPAGQVVDPMALRFSLEVNGEARQQGDPGLMLWPMFPLLAHISRFFTLLPGDVVLTGTPAGVAALRGGDRLALRLEGVADFSAVVAASGEEG